MAVVVEHMWRPVRKERGAAALLVLLTAMLLTVWINPPVARAQGDFKLLLTPQLAQIQLGPGSRTELTFQLSNNDKTKPLRAKVFLSDIKQGVRGQYLLSDSTMPYSCVAWMNLKDTLIEVLPNQMTTVKVPVKVPGYAKGGGYGAVVFEMMPQEAPRGERSQASNMYRFRLPAYVEIGIKRTGGSVRRLKAGEILIETAADNPQLAKEYGKDNFLVAAEIENTGNILLEVRGRLAIRDEKGHLAKLVPLGAGRGAILPGAKTKMRSILKRLNPGKYTIRAIIQYGARSPAISQTTFNVSHTRAQRLGGVDVSVPVEVDIRPELIRLNAPAKSFRSLGLTLLNREAYPVAIDVRIGQFYHDIDGQVWTTPMADSGRTIKRWMTYEPDSVTIGPSRQQNIRLTLNVPDSAAGGYYGCVLLIARPLDSAGAPTTAIPAELNVPIYLVVNPGSQYSGEIDDIEVDRTGGRGVTFKIVARNTGNIHTVATGSVTVQKWAEDKSVIDSLIVLSKPTFEDVGTVAIEVDSVFILPGERHMLSSQTVEQLPIGKYKAIVQVVFGPKQPPVTKEKEFVITKPVEKNEE